MKSQAVWKTFHTLESSFCFIKGGGLTHSEPRHLGSVPLIPFCTPSGSLPPWVSSESLNPLSLLLPQGLCTSCFLHLECAFSWLLLIIQMWASHLLRKAFPDGPGATRPTLTCSARLPSRVLPTITAFLIHHLFLSGPSPSWKARP